MIITIAAITTIKRLSLEKGRVVSPMTKPAVSTGDSKRFPSLVQMRPTTARITPRSPSVTITGATAAIGPSLACLKSVRINPLSINPPRRPPIATAKMNAKK
ncbi:unannotated protein [freshwater metagenome]|uniref:Unannotated protein n=1 Tax=freshwater metagenome TaxID=449393 RepID=A0A6J6EAW9_9ZZZZ